MPLSKYDRFYGRKGSASKALSAMKDRLGEKRGESVFYATMQKRKKEGAPFYKRKRS